MEVLNMVKSEMLEMDQEQTNPILNNPWAKIEFVEEFLYYCCPECQVLSHCQHFKDQNSFIQHVFASHPKAKTFLDKMNHQINIKNEPLDTEEMQEADFELDEPMSDEDFDESAEFLEPVEVDFPQVKVEEKKEPTEKDLAIVQCYFCCELMEKRYIKKHLLELHKEKPRKNYYGEPRPFKCHNCNMALKTEISKNRHVCFMPELKGKTCPICNQTQRSKRELERHMIKHSEARPFECNQCDMKFKTNSTLKCHVARMHEKVYSHVCSLCGDKFLTRSDLTRHEATHVNDKHKVDGKYKCDKCNVGFPNYHSLAKHNTQIHEKLSDKTMTCEYCGKILGNYRSYTNHINQTHPSDEVLNAVKCNCDKCEKTFENSTDLNNHLKECLETSKNLKCPFCMSTEEKKNYVNSVALIKHIAESHRKIVWVCDLCNKHYNQSNALKKHIESFHEGKTFQCEFCDMEFNCEKTRRAHVFRDHDKSKLTTYNCEYCEFIGQNRTVLAEHVNAIHTKEIKYECQLCDYYGYRKKTLNAHIREVHESKLPFYT